MQEDEEEAPVVGRYLPMAQSMQDAEEDAPVVGRYFPAAQSAQMRVPVAEENLPTGQSTHESVALT